MTTSGRFDRINNMEPPTNNTRTLELDDGSRVEVVEKFSKSLAGDESVIQLEIDYGDDVMVACIVSVDELKRLSGQPGETQEAFVEGLTKVVFEDSHLMMRAAVADN